MMKTQTPSSQQRLLPVADPQPDDIAGSASTSSPTSATAGQLRLLNPADLPPKLRIDARTRQVGRVGIAELRRILAGHDEAA